MKSKLLHEVEGLRTFALVMDEGDEAAEGLARFAKENAVSAAQITAVGAFQEATLLCFDWSKRDYDEIPVNEQCEVAAFIGDIVLDDQGQPAAHVHMVLGKRDGAAMAGHLGRGVVRPTLEVLITETPAHLRRVKDARTGLGLIDPEL